MNDAYGYIDKIVVRLRHLVKLEEMFRKFVTLEPNLLPFLEMNLNAINSLTSSEPMTKISEFYSKKKRSKVKSCPVSEFRNNLMPQIEFRNNLMPQICLGITRQMEFQRLWLPKNVGE
jgi:hypothetical protein